MLIGLCQYDYLRCWHGNRLELPSEFSFCLEVVLLFQSQIENSYFSPPKQTVRRTVPSLFRNLWVMKRESGQVCPLLGGAISTFIKSVSYSWGVLLIHSLIILESSVVPDTLLQDRGPETWIWSLLLQSCVKWETAVFSQRISRRVLVVGTRGKSCEREVRSAQKVLTGRSSGVGGDTRLCVSPGHGSSGDSQVSTAGLWSDVVRTTRGSWGEREADRGQTSRTSFLDQYWGL